MTADCQPGEVRDFNGCDYVWEDCGRGYEWIEKSEWDGRGWLRPLLDKAIDRAVATAQDAFLGDLANWAPTGVLNGPAAAKLTYPLAAGIAARCRVEFERRTAADPLWMVRL